MTDAVCVVTTWELRAAGRTGDGAQSRQQWFRLVVYPHGRGGGGHYRVWRSLPQVWKLNGDLARLFPGYQPAAIKQVTEPDVRSKLVQVLLSCVCGHKLTCDPF